MELIRELEDKIIKLTKSIALANKQLEEHLSGTKKLTFMAEASAEANKERNTHLLQQYQNELLKLKSLDQKELTQKLKEKQELERANYFKYQEVRIRRNKSKKKRLKKEAVLILEELPKEVQIEDDELFHIALMSLELNLDLHCQVYKALEKIKAEFDELTKDALNENNQFLLMLSQRIPILILRFSILLNSIKESIKDQNLSEFRGMPKFEDWWINELWTSHQAYIALFKWKGIISYLCINQEQINAWNIIFKNWIFVKKLLNTKGTDAYTYNCAFDKLMKRYANLEDEFDESNLNSMKIVVENITKKEDFSSISKEHNVITPYLEFKLKKINELSKEEV